MTHLHRC